MKFHIYLLALLTTTLIYSQEEEKFTITKGTKEIGLSLNYSYQKSKEDGTDVNPVTHNFLVAPSVGYAIKNNLVIGAEVRFSALRETTDVEASRRFLGPDLQTYGIGFFPYIKKYFSISKALLFNLQGRVGYEAISQEDFNTNQTIEANQFSLGITPGFTFSLNNKLAFVADFGFIGYSSTKNEDSRNFVRDSKRENFDIRFNASDLLVGLVYFIK
ncbi:outer membrane beta-barrel protein [Hyunsoonleella sp. 2307UL5-6]|uniref:outer membrane beta-barrel protein n=1 Tax=Hyunsoonleella sp. 2307UL5-6 TaxID=3384768 RepID=UPI0039BC6481